MEWVHVLTIIGGNAAMFLPIFFWLRTEANADRRDILSILSELKEEMKDFHGRLERQDAEFKGRLALQDAEFKYHMMNHHEERRKL
jgi:hypothetical protein